MKISIIAALIPCLAMAAPIETRDSAQNVVVKNIDVESLLTGHKLQVSDGAFHIFAFDKQTKITNPDEPPVKDFHFPAQDGKLSVYDGTGQMAGVISANQDKGFDISLDNVWLAKQSTQPVPKLRAPYGEKSISKRGLNFGKMSSRIGKFGGGTGASNQLAFQLGVMVGEWLWGTNDKRDDSGETLLLPIFVQGPGVTFESFLGLGGITQTDNVIKLADFGTVFVDIDNVVDFYDCDLCQLPTSSSN